MSSFISGFFSPDPLSILKLLVHFNILFKHIFVLNPKYFAGGVFKLELFLPEEYPMAAPKVICNSFLLGLSDNFFSFLLPIFFKKVSYFFVLFCFSLKKIKMYQQKSPVKKHRAFGGFPSTIEDHLTTSNLNVLLKSLQVSYTY